MTGKPPRSRVERLVEELMDLRLRLSPVAAVTLGQLLEPYVEEGAPERQRRGKHGAKFAPCLRGKTRDVVANAVGMSGFQWEKVIALLDAADADPGRYGDLLEQMERAGRVNGAWGELQKRRDRERVATLSPVIGKFRALVVDPPWKYETGAPERGIRYHELPDEEILALPVPEWADERCHLWLWTTNFHMPLAHRCVEAWGFEHKSILTWQKPKMGQGWHLRNNTEHCLLGVRGQLSLAAADIPSSFTAAVREHSEKPEEFYAIVRRASFAPIGEAFQRTAREGFHDLYVPERA